MQTEQTKAEDFTSGPAASPGDEEAFSELVAWVVTLTLALVTAPRDEGRVKRGSVMVPGLGITHRPCRRVWMEGSPPRLVTGERAALSRVTPGWKRRRLFEELLTGAQGRLC